MSTNEKLADNFSIKLIELVKQGKCLSPEELHKKLAGGRVQGGMEDAGPPAAYARGGLPPHTARRVCARFRGANGGGTPAGRRRATGHRLGPDRGRRAGDELARVRRGGQGIFCSCWSLGQMASHSPIQDCRRARLSATSHPRRLIRKRRRTSRHSYDAPRSFFRHQRFRPSRCGRRRRLLDT